MTKYEPEVNDYVQWRNHQGWVYFKDEEHITIEIGVKDRPHCEYTKNSLHCKDHILIVCQNWYWHELKYVKSRKSIYEEQ